MLDLEQALRAEVHILFRCPECGTSSPETHDWRRMPAECPRFGCGRRGFPAALRAVDPVSGAAARCRAFTEEGVLRALGEVASERGGRIGERYLAQHDPELLFNCRAHFSSYRNARREFRRWLRAGGAQGEALLVHPTLEVPAPEPAAEPAPEIPIRVRAIEPTPAPATPAPQDDQAPPSPAVAQAESRGPIDLRIAVSDAGEHALCVYCRDGFDEDGDGEDDEPRYLCPCGAVFHLECRREMPRCSTLGCAEPFRAPEVEPEGEGAGEGENEGEGEVVTAAAPPQPPGPEALVLRESAARVGVGTGLAVAFAALCFPYPTRGWLDGWLGLAWRLETDPYPVLGLLALGLAVVLQLRARAVIVDRRLGEVRWRRGFLLPVTTRAIALEDAARVLICRGEPDVVALAFERSAVGRLSVEVLVRARDEVELQGFARALADHLGLPIGEP